MVNLKNMKPEINRLSINIFGVCETKKANNRDFVSDKYRIIYAFGEKDVRGVGLIQEQYMDYWILSTM